MSCGRGDRRRIGHGPVKPCDRIPPRRGTPLRSVRRDQTCRYQQLTGPETDAKRSARGEHAACSWEEALGGGAGFGQMRREQVGGTVDHQCCETSHLDSAWIGGRIHRRELEIQAVQQTWCAARAQQRAAAGEQGGLQSRPRTPVGSEGEVRRCRRVIDQIRGVELTQGAEQSEVVRPKSDVASRDGERDGPDPDRVGDLLPSRVRRKLEVPDPLPLPVNHRGARSPAPTRRIRRARRGRPPRRARTRRRPRRSACQG